MHTLPGLFVSYDFRVVMLLAVILGWINFDHLLLSAGTPSVINETACQYFDPLEQYTGLNLPCFVSSFFLVFRPPFLMHFIHPSFAVDIIGRGASRHLAATRRW